MVARLLPWAAFPHRCYVEPFAGGLSVLLAKAPSSIEVVNDADEALMTFFRILRDKDQFWEFFFRISTVPYARQEYREAKATWREIEDPIERTARWFVNARQNFGGDMRGGWGYTKSASNRGMAQTTSAWLSTLESLPAIHARLQQVQIECGSWEDVLSRYDSPDTFQLIDPPYLTDAGPTEMPYSQGMTVADHTRLVEALLDLKGTAILCGYPNAVYAPLEAAGWAVVQWQVSAVGAGHTRDNQVLGDGASHAKQPRTEQIWVHPRVMAWKNARGSLLEGVE